MDVLLVRYAPAGENIRQLAISEAKARLTDLVRRAEAGEEVVLTGHGHAVARLVAQPEALFRAND